MRRDHISLAAGIGLDRANFVVLCTGPTWRASAHEFYKDAMDEVRRCSPDESAFLVEVAELSRYALPVTPVRVATYVKRFPR